MVVLLLLFVSIFQPLTQVRADTETKPPALDSSNEVESEIDEIKPPQSEDIDEDEVVENKEDIVVENDKENEEPESVETQPPQDIATNSATTTEVDREIVEASVIETGQESTSSATTSNTSSGSISDETISSTSSTTTIGESNAVTPDSSLDVKKIATTTDIGVNEPYESSVTTNENYYQFSKDSCVQVADGSFYCGTAENATVPLEDSFYVALDEDGDSEIFARREGEVFQITSNTVTDAAPYYDPLSETLVWHQEVAERYQIMSYDFATEKTSQLTSGRVHNMEPNRYGDITVWQQWGSDNWDIVMHDGDSVVALTDDGNANVSPTVRGQYILWRTLYNDGQHITIYNQETKIKETITDVDRDLSLSNPRLMLVYEGVNSAGERITKGFDPETGKLVPLSTSPAPLPEDIPSSEPTEEVRALVQTKPAQEESVEAEDDTDDLESDAADVMPPATRTATSSEASTGTTTEAVSANNEDIIVPPFTSATSGTEVFEENAPSSSIPDLVIPPATSTVSQ